jgi:hypothetical protein
MGFVVVDPRFIEAELANGQLRIAHPLRVRLDDAYWLVWRPGREVMRPVASFRRWLAAELTLAGGGSCPPIPHPPDTPTPRSPVPSNTHRTSRGNPRCRRRPVSIR